MAIYRQLLLCRSIKGMRISAGLTQGVVAERLGISQAAYSRLENGEVEVSVMKLLELCNLYGVRAREIVELLEPGGEKG